MLPSGAYAPPEDGIHCRGVRRPHPKVAAAGGVQVGARRAAVGERGGGGGGGGRGGSYRRNLDKGAAGCPAATGFRSRCGEHRRRGPERNGRAWMRPTVALEGRCADLRGRQGNAAPGVPRRERAASIGGPGVERGGRGGYPCTLRPRSRGGGGHPCLKDAGGVSDALTRHLL